MNIAIVLSGGVGSRIKKTSTPKQYCLIEETPLINFCLMTFQKNENIDKIVIVADESWHEFIKKQIYDNNITKFILFAKAGRTRQHSIFNALKKLVNYASEDDVVIIHDAARPNVSNDLIDNCLDACIKGEASMPSLPVTDTIYRSKDGKIISEILERDELFAGQTPEAFKFLKYFNANKNLLDEEMSLIRGSSELAFKFDMSVTMVKGDSANYKITTDEDLEKFENFIKGKRKL